MHPPAYIDEPLGSFIARLADSTPEPAGGAALALAAASAAALLSLACRDAPSVDARAMGELTSRAQLLVDADVAAYREVGRGLATARAAGPGHAASAALDEALGTAIEVPFAVVEVSLRVLEWTARLASETRTPALGDLFAAAVLAEAAARGSLCNVRVNAALLADPRCAQRETEQADADSARLADLAEQARAALAGQGVSA